MTGNDDTALKSKFPDRSAQAAPVLEALTPGVRMRVEKLRELQNQNNELETSFLAEREALEAKYQKLYASLYSKRFEIVNGLIEVEGVIEDGAKNGDEDPREEKGVPSFWLNAMKTNEILAEEITERDEGALQYLKDIKWYKSEEFEGFTLEFLFDTNPYFKNTVLQKSYNISTKKKEKKSYNMVDKDEPILEKAIGTEIEWCSGKCLTQKLLKKKPKRGGKIINKTEKCESFFSFFSPPQVPKDGDDIYEYISLELQNEMDLDNEIGTTIRDKIIPHAVSWFTGEAAEFEATDDEDDKDDEEDDTEEDKVRARINSYIINSHIINPYIPQWDSTPQMIMNMGKSIADMGKSIADLC